MLLESKAYIKSTYFQELYNSSCIQCCQNIDQDGNVPIQFVKSAKGMPISDNNSKAKRITGYFH